MSKLDPSFQSGNVLEVFVPVSPPPSSVSVTTALSGLDGEGRAEYWACLALRRTKGLGARSVCRLLRHFGSAYKAVHSVAEWKAAGVPPAKGASLAGGAWKEDARPEWEDSRDLDGHILLWTDDRYPPLLRELPDAPALLYLRGDVSLLSGFCVAVVGSRSCSRQSARLAFEIARELSTDGITVVSGMARGIDGAAHQGALTEKGGSIAVLGAGLDVVYPPENAFLHGALGSRGLLISEFPPGTRPDSSHFPIRNRIISGLSLGVMVVEAAQRSGSLITARLALEQNRAVYAVPLSVPEAPAAAEDAALFPEPRTDYGPKRAEGPEQAVQGVAFPGEEDGCAALLEQGAVPVRCAADILVDLLPVLSGERKRPVPTTPCPTSKTRGPARISPPSSRATRASSRTTRIASSRATRIASSGQAQASLQDPSPALPKGGHPSAPSGHVGHGKPKQAAPAAPCFPPGSREADVLALLKAHGPLPLDGLIPLLPEDERDAGALSALLLMLELRGVARRLPGMVYEAL